MKRRRIIQVIDPYHHTSYRIESFLKSKGGNGVWIHDGYFSTKKEAMNWIKGIKPSSKEKVIFDTEEKTRGRWIDLLFSKSLQQI